MDSFGAKISSGRGVMMGAAILFIMFFHLQSGHFGWWSNFCNCYGLWGVDVFMFLSGYGIAHSLRSWGRGQAGGKGLGEFYRKRLVRILPVCMVSGTLFYMLAEPAQAGLKAMLLQVSGMDMWYVRVILLCYLFSPLFLWVMRRWCSWWLMLGLVLVVELLLWLSITLQPAHFPMNLYATTVCWGLARLPAYLMGLFVAEKAAAAAAAPAAGAKMTPWGYLLPPAVLCLGFSLVARYMFSTGQGFWRSDYWDLMPLAALAFTLPVLCALAGLCLQHLPQWLLRVPRAVLEWCGRHSLELYVVHLPLYPIIARSGVEPAYYPYFAMGLSALLAWLLHLMVAQLRFPSPPSR